MVEDFEINIYKIRPDEKLIIEGKLSPTILELEAGQVKEEEPIDVYGQLQRVQETIVLHFTIKARIYLPCRICNENSEVDINVENGYHTIHLNKLSSNILDLKPIIRELVILEIPMFGECGNGNCKNRENIEKYLRK